MLLDLTPEARKYVEKLEVEKAGRDESLHRVLEQAIAVICQHGQQDQLDWLKGKCRPPQLKEFMARLWDHDEKCAFQSNGPKISFEDFYSQTLNELKSHPAEESNEPKNVTPMNPVGEGGSEPVASPKAAKPTAKKAPKAPKGSEPELDEAQKQKIMEDAERRYSDKVIAKSLKLRSAGRPKGSKNKRTLASDLKSMKAVETGPIVLLRHIQERIADGATVDINGNIVAGIPGGQTQLKRELAEKGFERHHLVIKKYRNLLEDAGHIKVVYRDPNNTRDPYGVFITLAEASNASA